MQSDAITKKTHNFQHKSLLPQGNPDVPNERGATVNVKPLDVHHFFFRFIFICV